MTEEQAKDFIMAAYQAEVEYRRRTFVEDKETLSNIDRFAKFLTGNDSRFGIMFSGICGNGKTTLLYAFQSALNYLVQRGVIEDSNVGISIIDAKEIVQYAKDVNRFQSLRSRDMLAIEDMGREPLEIMEYGNVISPVVDLLEYRYNNQLFTAITTNLTPKEIREKYGNRIADRFNEMFDKIIFENGTYRKS
jgi:DNA replication protein DnaC